MSNHQLNQKQKDLFKQLIRDQLNVNIDELKNKDQPKEDNSFVYLENETLQTIITNMLANLNMHYSPDNNNDGVEPPDLEDISSYLDTLIEDNKMAFEEVIAILKEKD
ncbi:hypothetical protein [Oceanobacillus rekensis]|uniref:hypothetical protein n=1 Tax=Oceanobacillus rekensis TaxID=937927 RepID=UPI000B43D2F6|nr:hypothetical protein [Oceanobacillus rekensis]